MWLNASLDIKDLTLPKLKGSKIIFADLAGERGPLQNTDVALAPQPFAVSQVFQAKATLVSKTTRDDGKQIYHIRLTAPEIENLSYEPGDTIGILTENSDRVVGSLLHLSGDIRFAHEQVRLRLDQTKLNYLPEITSPTHLVKNYLNFNCIPQKMHLRLLSDYCRDRKERRLLQVLCSKEGSDLYRKLILEAGVTILDVMTSLSACEPPVIALAEYLPRLLARPYSIASSPLTSPSSIDIVLSVLPGWRAGICTGMLRDKFSGDGGEASVRMYLRKSMGFRLPSDPDLPLILLGPGTGIAPYLGFLEHRKCKKMKGKVYLFTGFPTKKDFLFEQELQQHSEKGTLTRLFVSYSREPEQPHAHVQDIIRKEWELVGQVVDEGGIIYECGDLKVMSQSISDAITEALKLYYQVDESEARAKIKALKQEKRYLQDVWC